jgi:hypothetical protein
MLRENTVSPAASRAQAAGSPRGRRAAVPRTRWSAPDPVSGGRRRIPPFYPRRRGPAPGFGLGSTSRAARRLASRACPSPGPGRHRSRLIAGGPVGRRVLPARPRRSQRFRRRRHTGGSVRVTVDLARLPLAWRLQLSRREGAASLSLDARRSLCRRMRTERSRSWRPWPSSASRGFAAEARELPDRPGRRPPICSSTRELSRPMPSERRLAAARVRGRPAARPATGSTFSSTDQCPWYWPVLRCNYLGQCFCTLF